MEARTRKVRSDKGSIMATRRDQYCIAWIAEMYAARTDQVQQLLSKFPDKRKPFKDGKGIAATTLKDQLSRWRRAGWIEYHRVLADMPGWIWPTKKGLALVDLDEIYQARAPASTRLDHIYAVNALRLALDKRFAWKSERRYRSEQLAKQKTKKGDSLGPIPDAIVTTKDGPVAIEVEITAKKPAEIENKLVRLVRHYTSDGLGYRAAFPLIWFYVPNERIKELIEDGIEELKDDEQARVSVGVTDILIASRFR
jgi:hypothetical protein